MNQLITSWLLAAGLLLLSHCTNDNEPIAGPSTEEGNPVLLGKVMSSQTQPASGAVIRLYRKPEITDSAAFIPVPALTVSTTTDSQGNFTFYEVVSGAYNLEAADSLSGSYGFVNTIIIPVNQDEPIALDSIHLSKPGSIKGVASRGGLLGAASNSKLQNGFIQVKVLEIDRWAVTSPNGAYELSNFPPGNYTLAFYASDGFLTQYFGPVTIHADSVHVIDTVTLIRAPWLAPPKPFGLGATVDSGASIVTLQWQAVAGDNIAGYKVERRTHPLNEGTVFSVSGTLFQDTLTSFNSGDSLYYVVRTVSKSFMESANEGPVIVLVP